ncbi:hypothetical protein F4561_004323 [Lipingzhangella halophila]|uniref:Uncharacterized protein n=1 Tax=Lipingzhangella halophila TaxID=1783352 RepID=A0A7W7RL11_9ACTN|nr:hypothetical protein [Lipingzhangella halophila]
MASTRARDTPLIAYHGEPGRFRYPLIATRPAA